MGIKKGFYKTFEEANNILIMNPDAILRKYTKFRQYDSNGIFNKGKVIGYLTSPTFKKLINSGHKYEEINLDFKLNTH